jgi:hypothetical protein
MCANASIYCAVEDIESHKLGRVQKFQQQRHTKLNIVLGAKFICLEDSKRSDEEAQI